MTATSRRCLSWAVACMAVGAIVLSGIPILFGSPRPAIHVEWRDVGPAERSALERAFGLSAPLPVNGTRWAYEPLDTSTETLRAIVSHQSVADTAGINRRALTMVSSPPLSPRRGGLLASAPSWAARVAKLIAYGLFGVAVVAFMLLRETLVYGRLQSPFTLRAAWAAFLVNPAASFAIWRSRALGWMQRGVPVASAEAAGLFRIVFAQPCWRTLRQNLRILLCWDRTKRAPPRGSTERSCTGLVPIPLYRRGWGGG